MDEVTGRYHDNRPVEPRTVMMKTRNSKRLAAWAMANLWPAAGLFGFVTLAADPSSSRAAELGGLLPLVPYAAELANYESAPSEDAASRLQERLDRADSGHLELIGHARLPMRRAWSGALRPGSKWLVLK